MEQIQSDIKLLLYGTNYKNKIASDLTELNGMKVESTIIEHLLKFY